MIASSRWVEFFDIPEATVQRFKMIHVLERVWMRKKGGDELNDGILT